MNKELFQKEYKKLNQLIINKFIILDKCDHEDYHININKNNSHICCHYICDKQTKQLFLVEGRVLWKYIQHDKHHKMFKHFDSTVGTGSNI